MKSTREKVLLLVLAPLAVLVIYSFLLSKKQTESLTRVEEQLKALRAKGDPQFQLMQKNAVIDQLDGKLVKLRADKGRLTEQWNQLIGVSQTPGRRNEKLERLTAVFKQYGLTVLEQAEAEGKDRPPAALELVTKKFTENNTQNKPQMLRIRVAGSYTDLLGALKHLAAGEPLVVPLGMTMKEASHMTELRDWTLVVWI